MRKTLQVVLLLVVTSILALAQEAPQLPPAVSAEAKELVAAWILADQNAAKTLLARQEALFASAEGRAFLLAREDRARQQAATNVKVTKQFPGYEIDFAAGKLVLVKQASPPVNDTP